MLLIQEAWKVENFCGQPWIGPTQIPPFLISRGLLYIGLKRIPTSTTSKKIFPSCGTQIFTSYTSFLPLFLPLLLLFCPFTSIIPHVSTFFLSVLNCPSFFGGGGGSQLCTKYTSQWIRQFKQLSRPPPPPRWNFRFSLVRIYTMTKLFSSTTLGTGVPSHMYMLYSPVLGTILTFKSSRYRTNPISQQSDIRSQYCASGSGRIRNYLQVRIRIRN